MSNREAATVIPILCFLVRLSRESHQPSLALKARILTTGSPGKIFFFIMSQLVNVLVDYMTK
jgi:hypothetical protein